MKNSRNYLVVCLVFVLFLGGGCKLFENKHEKVLSACEIFDSGIKGNVPTLEGILTEDFTMTINTEPADLIDKLGGIDDHEVSRSEVIALVSDPETEFEEGMEASFANFVFSGNTATVDLIYSQSTELVIGVFSFQLSLRDEGSFFAFDWKISNCYLDTMLMGALY